MLKPPVEQVWSAEDASIFAALIPESHFLRRLLDCVDFERFRPLLVDAYDADFGRPAIDPIVMLKIMFLRFHYRLSDRQVAERTKTDVAFRWFLGLDRHASVPNHTSATYFRERIGEQRFTEVFQALVTQAREHGLVKDRLRLKDATHLLADVADAKPKALLAQIRDRLLAAAKVFWPEWVGQKNSQMKTLRGATAELSEKERLAARLEFLRGLLTEIEQLLKCLPVAEQVPDPRRDRLHSAIQLAERVLDQCGQAKPSDRVVSGVDPDARTGKHGSFYVGYMLDVMIDADSEIITAVNVLPANGAEAADAVNLLQQEEAAQHNDVEALSMDGIGYNGPVLRELSDPQGLNVEVTVPVPTLPVKPIKLFGPERFSLEVIDGQETLTCPAGQTTTQRKVVPNGTDYAFADGKCAACPRRGECQEPNIRRGRTVTKNSYDAEYQRARAKTQTPEYKQTRREHPRIERKLAELTGRHGLRRACYRSKGKVLMQALLTTWVTNAKRIVTLLCRQQKICPSASGGIPRAELVGAG
jgi:transposase